MASYLDKEEFRRLLLSWPAKAIHYLYTNHRNSLIRLSEQRTRSRVAAEDIVQEAITAIWEKLDKLGSKKDFAIESYLYAIVRNKSISYHNKTREENLSSLDENRLSEDAQRVDSIANQYVEALWKILYSLPPREQQCVIMRYFQEMAYSEIADLLGITIKAVERNLTSARKRMRKIRYDFL